MNSSKETFDQINQISNAPSNIQEDTLSDDSNELELDDSYLDEYFDDKPTNAENSKDLWDIIIRDEQIERDKKKDECNKILFEHNWEALLNLANKNNEIVKYVIKEKIYYVNSPDKNGNTLMYYAIKRNNEDLVKYLLNFKEVDFNKELNKGLFIALKNRNENMVKFLISQGANVNTRDTNKRTPLFIAVDNNDENMVEYLVELGAKVEVKDISNMTPLYLATSHNNESMVKYLIDHGANVNVSKLGETPLYIATLRNNERIVKILVENGAFVDSNSGETELLIAVRNNNERIVKCLIDKTASFLINVINSNKEFPLLLAIKNNNEIIVKILLDHGANVNLRNSEGETPILMAVKTNNKEIIKILADHGAIPLMDTREKEYGFPPVEIIAKLKEYTMTNITLSSDIKLYDDKNLREKIKEKYSCLYRDPTVIEHLDLQRLSNQYTELIQCVSSCEYNVLRVSFSFHRFIELFQFDQGLVRKWFKQAKPIPFVVEYKLGCCMQCKTSEDSIIHNIIFNQFYGGNPILKKTTSQWFKHIQTRRNLGQVILTDTDQT